MSTWQEIILAGLAEPPGKKTYWLYDLNTFKGWQDFTTDLVCEHGAVCFTHKTAMAVGDIYNGQRVVVFCLAECDRNDNIRHVYQNIAKLKRGILFCTSRGVQIFSPPHVLVFANFPGPDKHKTSCSKGVSAS